MASSASHGSVDVNTLLGLGALDALRITARSALNRAALGALGALPLLAAFIKACPALKGQALGKSRCNYLR